MRLDVREWISTLLSSLNAGLTRLLRSPQIARLNVLKLHLRWQKFLVTVIAIVALVVNLSGINLWLPSPVNAQFPLYPCDGQLYQIRQLTGPPTNSQVFRVNRPSFTSTQIGTITPNVVLNGFAYRKQDGLMYAIDVGTAAGFKTMYRIDQNGVVSTLPLPVGSIPNANNYNTATMDAAGNYYIKATGVNNTIYRISDPGTATPTITPITLSAAINMGDMAISPIDGLLYGLLDTTLYRINLATGTIEASLALTPALAQVGTAFFDASGTFYAYANGGAFHVVDVTTGATTFVANGDATTNSDGANCAFPSPEFVIDVAKAVGTVTQVSPLAFDVPYTVVLTSTGTQPAPNVQLTDNLNRTFSTGTPTITISTAPAVTAGTCTANAGYNGLLAGNTSLLTGSDTLAAGASCTVTFTTRITYPDQASIPNNINQNNTVFASSVSAGPNPGYTFIGTGNTVPLPPPALLASANATVPVAFNLPNLTLTKIANRVIDTDGSGTTTPGDVIEYTITVDNAAGAGTATGVTITDPIPANTTYVAGSLVAEGTSRTDAAADDQAHFTGTAAVFRLGTGANATNGGTLAGGTTATAVFRVTLQVGSPPQVSNTATLSGTNFANQTDTEDVPVAAPAPPPAIGITKNATLAVDADGSGTITTGDTLTYSITVTNGAAGGVATGVVVNDPIPANTTYVAGSLQIDAANRTDATGDDTANADATAAVFRLGAGANATNGGTLAPGASSTAVFRVLLGAGAVPSVTNTATVSGTNFTPQNAPVTTPVGAAAGGTPNVLLVKRLTRINTTDITGFVDAPGVEDNNPNWPVPAATYLRGAIGSNTILPGDELEFTIYFLSAGTAPATNIRICDVLDPNLEFLPIAFNGLPGDGGLAADQGIALALSPTALPTAPTNGLTNISDTPDRGQFLLPGSAIPASCNSTAANTSGVVVVDVVRSPTTLPRATTPGTPTNSYGFIRLRARVK